MFRGFLKYLAIIGLIISVGDFCAGPASVLFLSVPSAQATPVADLWLPSPCLTPENDFTGGAGDIPAVIHQTSKIRSTATAQGWFAAGFADTCLGERIPGFEFPAHSSVNYLHLVSLWVGGVIGDDTLVSVAAVQDWEHRHGQVAEANWGSEFHPAGDRSDSVLLQPFDAKFGDAFRARYVDTITSGADDLPEDFFGRPHTPLNIAVTQKSYTTDEAPYRTVVLYDFTITNIGPDIVQKAYVGLYVDPVVGADASAADDDLVGSLRNLSTMYAFDNDGDPQTDGYVSATGAVGVRPVLVYPPVADTNFNWWLINDSIDFGPRLADDDDNPWRDFETGGKGCPSGDANKYYIMSHPEWDYDQVFTAAIPDDGNDWHNPPASQAPVIAEGGDVKGLLSVGPVDLAPTQSIRVMFAVFGAEFLHIDPGNAANLTTGDYRDYFDNLYRGVLQTNARYAAEMASELLDPTQPPTGLAVSAMSHDTAWLCWDDWTLPDVSGYGIYLKALNDTQTVAPRFVKPGEQPGAMGIKYETFTAPSSRGFITGLQPGQLYFATIAHQTNNGESRMSAPTVIGDFNAALETEAVDLTHDFAFFYESDAALKLTWAAENDNISYYKIYKSTDSTRAVDRYYPFLTPDSSGLPYLPRICYGDPDSEFCFYEMDAYDSTADNTAIYFDHDPVEGAWYWITGVTLPGYESAFSDFIKAETISQPTKDILVVLGSSFTHSDYVIADSLYAFYERLLAGYDFDIYNWADTNLDRNLCPSLYCTDWTDLAEYRMVIVEEFPESKILTDNTEAAHKLFTRLLDGGRNVAYFGLPPGRTNFNLSSLEQNIVYDAGSFEARYFNLRETSVRGWTTNYGVLDAEDSLAGFVQAIPARIDLPILRYDSHNRRTTEFFNSLFNVENCLPLTPAFHTNEKAEILYRFGSAYPETSHLQNMVCGQVSRHEYSNAWVFSFHLWGMEDAGARELLDYILQQSPSVPINNTPPALPRGIVLGQNYPNPFNAVTLIRFELTRNTRVTLDIFNILGRQVAKLIDGEPYSAGAHTIAWDGRNRAGRYVASGIYFYQINAEGQAKARKMVLLK